MWPLPLPQSSPVRCCHMPIWYQHIVGNTLLSPCLFILVPVYQCFLSLCVSSSTLPPHIPTAPAVHLLLKASWELPFSFAFLSIAVAQGKRNRVSFSSSWRISDTSPCTLLFLQLMKDVHIWAFLFRDSIVAMRDHRVRRGQISQWLSLTLVHHRSRLFTHRDGPVTIYCYKLRHSLITILQE